MIEPTHKRCKHRIQDSDGHVKEFASINAAKRESRKLGLGAVRVVEKLHNITGTSVMYKAKSEHDVKATPMPKVA